jgi:single-strand DNA-binding protein
MINNVVLMGRITHNLEPKATANGVNVVSFTLAVERSFVKQGEKRQADFVDCVAWRNTADFITNYFRKGSMLAVTGAIQTRSYEDKNGNKRKAVEVVVDGASFCGEKNNNAGQTTTPNLNVSPPASDYEEIENDDDLPF